MSRISKQPSMSVSGAGHPVQRFLNRLALVQGLYYFLTGVWPLVDIDSFQAVTGPKADLWLVRTVGTLITAIAVALLAADWQRQITAPVWIMAVGSAAALTAIDILYVSLGVIDRIYLADAVAELVLIACWCAWAYNRKGIFSSGPR